MSAIKFFVFSILACLVFGSSNITIAQPNQKNDSIIVNDLKIKASRSGSIIDSSALPFIPSGWTVESHDPEAWVSFDSNKANLYWSDLQKGEMRYIEGYKLQKELSGLPILNANVLDHLLSNKDLIPKNWKNKYIFFWGTIYRSPGGLLAVRCLLWTESLGWHWSGHWLGGSFGRDCPTVLAGSF